MECGERNVHLVPTRTDGERDGDVLRRCRLRSERARKPSSEESRTDAAPMIGILGNSRMWLATGHTDMRRGRNLGRLVQEILHAPCGRRPGGGGRRARRPRRGGRRTTAQTGTNVRARTDTSAGTVISAGEMVVNMRVR